MSKNISFIQQLAPHAQRVQKKHGILASLVIAQACHESAYGRSGLARRAKNLFGIKGTYHGQYVVMKTHEYKGSERITVNAKFCKYPSYFESLMDLVELYEGGVSWNPELYSNLIGETNYKQACRKVEADGYATDPRYAEKLIRIIEQYDLTRYDQAGRDVSTENDHADQTEKRTEGKAIVPFPGSDFGYGLTPYGKAMHEIKRIQRALNLSRPTTADNIDVDGYYGPVTEAAVIDYQRRHDLKVDGIVGPVTWNTLF